MYLVSVIKDALSKKDPPPPRWPVKRDLNSYEIPCWEKDLEKCLKTEKQQGERWESHFTIANYLVRLERLEEAIIRVKKSIEILGDCKNGSFVERAKSKLLLSRIYEEQEEKQEVITQLLEECVDDLLSYTNQGTDIRQNDNYFFALCVVQRLVIIYTKTGRYEDALGLNAIALGWSGRGYNRYWERTYL